jgi:outer membrane translocation and assembly module TamA
MQAIRFLLSFGIILLSYWATASEKEPVLLCPGWKVVGSIDPKLTDVEKRLVCGDDKGRAWKTIPIPQAEYDLKNFLQERAFLHPVFTENGNEVVVNLGEPTRVKSLTLEGAPETLHIERKRKVVGEKMTPSLLGDVEKWVTSRLRALGYGCPKVTSTADTEAAEIHVSVKTGPLQDLIKVIGTELAGTDIHAIRRFDAFRVGERFNGDLLSITENRINSEAVVESNHFLTRCEADGVVATQQLVAGAPRLVTIGAGVDTEGLVKAKASWENTRLGEYASLLNVSLTGSFIEQTLQNTFNWFVFPDQIRPHLHAVLLFDHQNVENFETLTSQFQAGPETTWDSTPFHLKFSVGPSLQYFRTLQGTGPPTSHFLALQTELAFNTHDFEYYQDYPRTGISASLITDFSTKDIYSVVSAQRFNLRVQALWNLNHYHPPLLDYGFRGGVGSVISSEQLGPNSALPVSILQFLGGSNDLRGYQLQELPDIYGALMSFFADFEIRLASELPFNLDPFIFMDFGMVGREVFTFDDPLYRSPGFGLRWKSPIGVIRTTLAHGFPDDSHGHWQFYFSFGEEF